MFALVRFLDYQGGDLVGVFSTLDAAKAHADANRDTCDRFYVQLIQIDQPIDPDNLYQTQI